jgi:hypothetical protein
MGITFGTVSTSMVFRRMWIWALDLYETFGADWLIAASRLVQIIWIVKKADWTLLRVFVQNNLDVFTIHKRICRELYFLWRCI